MKRWQAMLAQIALSAAAIVIPALPISEVWKGVIGSAIVGAVGGVAKKTSESNPDGTHASEPWVK